MKSKRIDMKKAGNILRNLRGIRTRTGVAKQLDMPYSSLQAYEEGRREPSGRIKEKLAEYYHVTVEEIFLAD